MIKNFKLKIKNYSVNASNVCFYLILLFLPTQFGKHFWPEFSFIQGLRVDYLSPTLYFTDILILILMTIFLIDLFIRSTRKNSKFKIQNSKLKFKVKSLFSIWILFIGIVLIGIILSRSPLAGLYGLIKIFELVFFGFYISRRINSAKDLRTISLIFSIGVLFESMLAVFQYLNQSSLGGFFYFFGERFFNSSTPGIANASLNGTLILRPYGTFSHPNVLAGYLVIGMTVIIFNLKFLIFNQFLINKFKNIIVILSLFVGTLSLFLTMSRMAILIWLVVLFYLGLKQLLRTTKYLFEKPIFVISTKEKSHRATNRAGDLSRAKLGRDDRHKTFQTDSKSHQLKLSIFNFQFSTKILVVLIFIGSILLFSPIRYRFMNFNFADESLILRKDLIETAFLIIKDNPIFGVGLNNFLINLPYYQKNDITSLFSYLQPVHNIYLLIAAELGLIGFLFFIWFSFKTVKKIKNQKSKIKNMIYILFFIVSIVGFFDHYFLTLQQGQLLFALVLGLCWSKIKIDEGDNKRDNRIS